MKAIHEACEWLDRNRHLFQGSVQRPSILNMKEDAAAPVLATYCLFGHLFAECANKEKNIRTPCVFVFDQMEDKRLFLKEMLERNIQVSADAHAAEI